MVNCRRCLGLGFYLDRQCVEETCAHRGRPKTVTDDEGNTKKKRRPVMKCPVRPCACPAGAWHRNELRLRVAAQERRIRSNEEARARAW